VLSDLSPWPVPQNAAWYARTSFAVTLPVGFRGSMGLTLGRLAAGLGDPAALATAHRTLGAGARDEDALSLRVPNDGSVHALRSLTLITPIGIQVPGKPPFADLFAMSPETLFGTLFNDPTNIGEVMLDVSDPDVIVAVYEEQSTLARLLWNPRYDRKMPRRLRRVRCPALVLGAAEDRLVPNEAVDRYAEFLPDARVRRVPDTGHALIIEQPERVAEVVLEFTASLS